MCVSVSGCGWVGVGGCGVRRGLVLVGCKIVLQRCRMMPWGLSALDSIAYHAGAEREVAVVVVVCVAAWNNMRGLHTASALRGAAVRAWPRGFEAEARRGLLSGVSASHDTHIRARF